MRLISSKFINFCLKRSSFNFQDLKKYEIVQIVSFYCAIVYVLHHVTELCTVHFDSLSFSITSVVATTNIVRGFFFVSFIELQFLPRIEFF